jgi:hypothetical protein
LKTNELYSHHTKVQWDRSFAYEYIYWCLYYNINVKKLQQSMNQNISRVSVLLFLHWITLVNIADIYYDRLSLLSCPWAWQLPWDFPDSIGFLSGALEHDRKDILCKVTQFLKSILNWKSILPTQKFAPLPCHMLHNGSKLILRV